MKSVWALIYNWLVLPLFWLLVRLTALFHSRIRMNLRERQNAENEQHQRLVNFRRRDHLIWFHCASMGEYEALVPLLTALRPRQNISMVLTFFSISGIRNFQDHDLVDLVMFAPFDFRRRIRPILERLQPDLYIVTKHDIWPNHVWMMESAGVPVWLMNGNFHSGSFRLLPVIRSFHRALFSGVENVWPVNRAAAERFARIMPDERIQSPGETRYDRVLQRLQSSRVPPWLSTDYARGHFVFIAGSTWPADETVLLPVLSKWMQQESRLRLIIVPHEPEPEAVQTLLRFFTDHDHECQLWSDIHDHGWSGARVLLIDRVGLLAGIYQVGSAAYVGGGFTTGVHSVIEPAVFGLPVLFGPNHHVSAEASGLLACGGGFAVATEMEFQTLLDRWIREPETCRRDGRLAQELVEQHAGTSRRLEAQILTRLLENA